MRIPTFHFKPEIVHLSELRKINKEDCYKTITEALHDLFRLKKKEFLSVFSHLTEKKLAESPDLLISLSRYLSEWPVTNEATTLAILKYHAEGLPRSIAEKEGVIGEFEQSFNKVLRLNRKYVLSTASGTIALWNAYQALGVRPGVKVAVPSYTFHATNSPLIDLGGIPIMMDARPDSGNVSLEIIEQTLSQNKNIAVVVVAHMWGIPVAEMKRISETVHKYGAYLLEDCSQAHGATVHGLPVGSFGDIAIFSCQRSKGVPIGEGGVILTDDIIFYKKLLSKTHYRRKEPAIRGIGVGDEYDEFMEEGTGGIKARMHPFAAVEGISQLKLFPELLETRRKYVGYFSEKIADIPWLRMPHVPRNANPSWYGLRVQYLPEHNSNIPIDQYVDYLRKRGLDVHVGTSTPVHRLSLFQKAPPNYKYPEVAYPSYDDDSFPGADTFCKNRIVFPVFSKDEGFMEIIVDVYAKIMANRV